MIVKLKKVKDASNYLSSGKKTSLFLILTPHHWTGDFSGPSNAKL